MQSRSLLAIILVAIILALMVPISENTWRSTKAFTYDNLIFMDASYGRQ